MFNNHSRLTRGHARSRSRDASLDTERPGSGVSSSGGTHHHTSYCGEGGCSVLTTRRLEGIHDDHRSGSTEEDSGGHNTSRGSSPARPSNTLDTSPYTCSTPTLLRQAQGLIKGGETRSSSSLSSSCKKKSPLTARRSTATCEVSPPPSGASPGSINNVTPQQSRSTRLALHQEDYYTPSSTDDGDIDVPVSSAVSNGSGEGVDSLTQRIDAALDDVDTGYHDGPRARDALDHIQIKIKKTRELIKEEQKARDENVNEYLKLASNADKQQLSRIKAVFEKKNQKSSASIQHLQKKIEGYQRRHREIELHGLNSSHHRQPKEVLREVGLGLKRSMFINKPKEIAHRLKNKFGSADNIKELVCEEEKEEEKTHHGSATLPPGASLIPPSSNTPQASQQTPVSAPSGGATGSVGGGCGSSGGGGVKYGSDEGSECNSSITSESLPGGGGSGSQLVQLASPRNHQVGDMSYWDNTLMLELQERREENARLREEIETIKQTMTQEVGSLRECLAEERFKREHLEEQVNDLTELHQNEMENLRTTMTDMEEKVQYQSEERIRDLHEVVENCQTRISRMEHQQAQQQQQFLNLEGLDNGNARALIVKLINILLTVLQVLLLVVATVANILTPLLQTRGRLITTIAFLLFLLVVYIQLPEIKEYLESWTARSRRFFFAS